MSTTPPGVTGPSSAGPRLQYSTVTASATQSNLTTVAPYMFWLMFRNVASDGFVFEDPVRPARVSCRRRGASSPRRPGRTPQTHVTQDYVYNWTRDAAVVAIELANGPLPASQPLIDYVQFAQTCQNSGNGAGHFDRASFLINGAFRDRLDRSDRRTGAADAGDPGAVRPAGRPDAGRGERRDRREPQLPARTPIKARRSTCGRRSTGTRSSRARSSCSASRRSPPTPWGSRSQAWLANAIPWLQNALQNHWNGQYYQSLIPAPTDKAPYDPNSDIVMAAIYGAVAVTDTKLLATAALLRSQWDDASSQDYYPINGADHQRGIGPMMGRYPGDVYDGDNDQSGIDHPWAISTCNFAELYYRLANEITAAGAIPLDANSTEFFNQVGVTASTTPAAAAADAAGRRRPDAAGDHLPQRLPRAQRAVRRQHRL